ncbi:Vi polysaccharide biosynthesis UDP-N-acetylglucosamine C-6 dehydrogenase TviB [Exilibacterium tricleocarpae]|uniref:Vi polysaccharide biosynthesis UDP-N-acetylglucosamine C-6 dehydrogenase TviB n=1 Tax=Exilibacterium tricleocarpae TaxID=2591008 RepID=A0A545T3J3_9GAMM|nr:Vi polysaccharide biosynthesis UDP-N-acetylglucosamine C-6 dehydrogenase TviB [Exilibacterium tricleocarpae]TQV71780.1 Vi polysaccharide biosynthesis UDP-N-acetylglucosamine C-6 dehydrogenase TviB [Exilibacterium tricleocarpae]
MLPSQPSLAVIGQGYVGLPLAVEFGKQLPTLGFDINRERIAELDSGTDSTLEISPEELADTPHLSFSADEETLKAADIYIVTVPTPIDASMQPDLTPLEKASELIGRVIDNGNVVIFESTVYPGCTEEVCVPLIEKISGLTFNRDFYAGYSPERINPGDKEHRVHNIVKVTSGSTPEVADYIDQLYRRIVTVGTHKASSIKVAEAAKVIENTQRDINIALINELALIFNRLDIDTLEVLEAAGSKWNFLPFRPGLVGGHCISVDPYYLTHKAQQIGYHPEVILAGRRINDGMGKYVADTVIKLMTRRRTHVVGANILVMGLAFKENCPDLRNTRVIDIVSELHNYNANLHVHDPWVDKDEAREHYGIELIETPLPQHYEAIILCVGHQQFRQLGAAEIRKYGKDNSVLFDVKHILDKDAVDARL